MKNFQKIGAISAFYMVIAYIVGIIIFLVVLDYPSIQPDEQMDFLVKNHNMLYFTNLLLFYFFGIFLSIYVMALYERLKTDESIYMKLGALFGIIWSVVLIASGMISNAGMDPVLALYETDPAQGETLWVGIEAIAGGLGSGDGEILGSLFTLFVSLAVLQGGKLSKGLGYLGITVSVFGFLSAIPGLHDIAGIFGILQIFWFSWFGIIMLRNDLE